VCVCVSVCVYVCVCVCECVCVCAGKMFGGFLWLSDLQCVCFFSFGWLKSFDCRPMILRTTNTPWVHWHCFYLTIFYFTFFLSYFSPLYYDLLRFVVIFICHLPAANPPSGCGFPVAVSNQTGLVTWLAGAWAVVVRPVEVLFTPPANSNCADYRRKINWVKLFVPRIPQALAAVITNFLWTPFVILVDSFGDMLRHFMDKFNAVERVLGLVVLLVVFALLAIGAIAVFALWLRHGVGVSQENRARSPAAAIPSSPAMTFLPAPSSSVASLMAPPMLLGPGSPHAAAPAAASSPASPVSPAAPVWMGPSDPSPAAAAAPAFVDPVAHPDTASLVSLAGLLLQRAHSDSQPPRPLPSLTAGQIVGVGVIPDHSRPSYSFPDASPLAPPLSRASSFDGPPPTAAPAMSRSWSEPGPRAAEVDVLGKKM
jgi:hypothetical protein